MEKRTASQVGKSNVATAKTHERRVAKLFSEWSGHEFRRRRVEGRDVSTMIRDATGDVVPVARRSRFNIEAKKGKGFSLDAILNVDTIATNIFTAWWHQSNYDANLYSKTIGSDVLPFLIFKPHPSWDWVAFPQRSLEFLEPPEAYKKDSRQHVLADVGESKLWFPAFAIDAYAHCGQISCNVKHTHNNKNKEFVPLSLEPCYIARWHTFAENVNPETFFFAE